MTDNTCASIEERFKAEEEMNEFMKQKKVEALNEFKTICNSLLKIWDIYDSMNKKKWEYEKIVRRDLWGEFNDWICSSDIPFTQSLDEFWCEFKGYTDELEENLENTK